MSPCMTIDGQDPALISDDVLVLRAASGDQLAFHQLYDRHKQRVFARLTRILGASADREDVLQQVFLRLHRALRRFRMESKFVTFLYRITSNVAIDHLRHRRRQVSAIEREGLDELVATLGDPVSRVHARQQLGQLFAAFDQLRPKRRVAFVLVAVEGLSVEDAAQQLGTTTAAVRHRVAQARAQLTAVLAQHERGTRITWRSV